MPKTYDVTTNSKASDKHLPSFLRKSEETKATLPKVKNPLESQGWQKNFRKLQQWRRQARIYQADNRTQMAIDEDYYDGIQLEAEELAIYLERSQPPLVYNVIKNTINWLLGTERKNRVEWKVLPRAKDDVEGAKAKTKLIKYVSDVSKSEYVRSEAFTECVCAGLGWLEHGAKNTDAVLYVRNERWRNMWYDHLDTSIDGSLMRFVFREKWIDLDIAQNMFPEFSKDFETMAEAVNSLYPYHPEETAITDRASEFDLESDFDILYGGPFDGSRPRIKMVEMQYRMPENVEILHIRDKTTQFGALDGKIFRSEKEDHNYLVKNGYFYTTPARRLVVRHALFAGKLYLQDEMTPYDHGRFDFVPLYCYRRKRDNMPYSIIRDLRDPQSDLNRRRSRSLFLLSASQVIVEKGAVDNMIEFHDEMQRPDGIPVVNDGVLSNKRILVLEHHAKIKDHTSMAQDDERFIRSISGITNDTEWQKRKELSGKAINLMQNQGLVSHGVLFDNYYRALQSSGEITLSNLEQFYDREKEVRITGIETKGNPEDFIEINKYRDDGTIQNSITKAKADFIIGKQDFRETIRQAQTEAFMELITNISRFTPEAALSLLDLVVAMMDDLPNKDECIARIRKINKQTAPEDEMTDEQKQEAQMVEQKLQAEADAVKQLQTALMQIQVMEGQSKAIKNLADAAITKLEGFLKALEVAGNASVSPHLVEAADKLVKESQDVGAEGGQ